MQSQDIPQLNRNFYFPVSSHTILSVSISIIHKRIHTQTQIKFSVYTNMISDVSQCLNIWNLTYLHRAYFVSLLSLSLKYICSEIKVWCRIVETPPRPSLKFTGHNKVLKKVEREEVNVHHSHQPYNVFEETKKASLPEHGATCLYSQHPGDRGERISVS